MVVCTVKIQAVLKPVHLPGLSSSTRTGLLIFNLNTVSAVVTVSPGVRLIFRASTKRTTAFINVRFASIASAWARTGLRQNLSDRGYSFRHQKEMLELGEQRVEKLKRAALNMPVSTTRRALAVRTSCMCCTMPISRSCTTACRKIRRSIPQSICERALKPLAAAGFIATFAGLIYHYIGIGPNKETDDDEEDHHE